MPKPSSEWLQDDIQYFKSIHISKIVSLLASDEAKELGLTDEQHHCENMAIEFTNYPIEDRGLPQKSDFQQLVMKLEQEIQQGHNVAIHCRGGIGRAGLLSSCILIESGFTAEEAIDLVSNARKCTIPDTDKQTEFIMMYKSQLEKR